MKSTMERKKKQYGIRLFQLALNDAVQTNLSSVSATRSWMEEEKVENRKNKYNSKLSFQTDTSKRILKSISSGELYHSKDGKILNNHDTVSVSPNKSNNELSLNISTKKYILIDDTQASHSGKETIDISTKNMKEIAMNPCNIVSQKDPRPSHRSRMFNGFECTWLCEPDDSFNINDKSKHSIDLNSKEWNDMKTKGVNSTENTPGSNIDYDLPVFPQKNYIPDDFKEIGDMEAFNGDLNSNGSETTQDSLSEIVSTCIKTFPIEFIQDSTVLKDCFPPPKVVTSEQKSASDFESSPFIHCRTLSKSCESLNKFKCTGDKSHPTFGSGDPLDTVIGDNSLTDRYLTFDHKSTLRHFKCILPEDHSSEWFENTFQTGISSNYFFNESNSTCPIPKPHPVNSKASEELILNDQMNYHRRQSLPNFNMKTENYTSCYSGLLQHFPEYKSIR